MILSYTRAYAYGIIILATHFLVAQQYPPDYTPDYAAKFGQAAQEQQELFRQALKAQLNATKNLIIAQLSQIGNYPTIISYLQDHDLSIDPNEPNTITARLLGENCMSFNIFQTNFIWDQTRKNIHLATMPETYTIQHAQSFNFGANSYICIIASPAEQPDYYIFLYDCLRREKIFELTFKQEALTELPCPIDTSEVVRLKRVGDHWLFFEYKSIRFFYYIPTQQYYHLGNLATSDTIAHFATEKHITHEIMCFIAQVTTDSFTVYYINPNADNNINFKKITSSDNQLEPELLDEFLVPIDYATINKCALTIENSRLYISITAPLTDSPEEITERYELCELDEAASDFVEL